MDRKEVAPYSERHEANGTIIHKISGETVAVSDSFTTSSKSKPAPYMYLGMTTRFSANAPLGRGLPVRVYFHGWLE